MLWKDNSKGYNFQDQNKSRFSRFHGEIICAICQKEIPAANLDFDTYATFLEDFLCILVEFAAAIFEDFGGSDLDEVMDDNLSFVLNSSKHL